MPILEDFTGVKQDLQAAINNPAAVAPVRRRFDWRYGLVDGPRRPHARLTRLGSHVRPRGGRTAPTREGPAGLMAGRCDGMGAVPRTSVATMTCGRDFPTATTGAQA
jgi:hypothetical protein